MRIPKAEKTIEKNPVPVENTKTESSEYLRFSFESIQINEYFNLDGTCQNWAADLFMALQKASGIKVKDIYAGLYSGKNSTFRIHQHKDVKRACVKPEGVSIDEMWQIRISRSKGGIHGRIIENVFYVIWFDPHHNLYPDENHGGLKKVIPPSTCCKDRDEELTQKDKTIQDLKEQLDLFKELFDNI